MLNRNQIADMPRSKTSRMVRGGLSALALVVALSSAAPSYAGGVGNQGVGGLEADLGQADLMVTPLGLSFAGGKKKWGKKYVIDNPAFADAIGVGPGNNKCRFDQVAFRPFNKGSADSGPFLTKVYRNNQAVKSTQFDLASHDGLPGNGWYIFHMDLVQGWNEIQIDMDTNRVVAEEDEKNNSYTVDIKLNFPCTNVVNPGIGGLKAKGDSNARAKAKTKAKKKIRLWTPILTPIL